ncbi:MAG: hypothetical protein UV54_C0043G0015 [Candidatus Beckwithbacteria bacterium GW2011_GWA2_43_10]|uniref:DUF2000 domain-containing protein n=1 Tax=Candidatus Beckwithbacteria bacterium GW2011_GWA2_43_10 TaxID=1618369 RepID=A0A0G1C0Q4_9BACT|nr:MAG: hypothetical protein UV54_C0043G0015 [Candidatus Beckwithbacteria bacterium GW2011_GWA2_43_10]
MSQFPTKTAIIVERNLLPWQELNVTAFLASAIAHKFPETMGPEFEDASNVNYLAIFRQPVLVFQAKHNDLKKVCRKARENNLFVGIYTRPIFQTQGEDNIKAIAALKEEEQDLVGIVLYGAAVLVDKSTRGISLHK